MYSDVKKEKSKQLSWSALLPVSTTPPATTRVQPDFSLKLKIGHENIVPSERSRQDQWVDELFRLRTMLLLEKNELEKRGRPEWYHLCTTVAALDASTKTAPNMQPFHSTTQKQLFRGTQTVAGVAGCCQEGSRQVSSGNFLVSYDNGEVPFFHEGHFLLGLCNRSRRRKRYFWFLFSCFFASISQIDEEQWVYLQNLILVADEAVNNPFSTYQQDRDEGRLAEELKHVRNNHALCLPCTCCSRLFCVTCETCSLLFVRGAVTNVFFGCTHKA